MNNNSLYIDINLHININLYIDFNMYIKLNIFLKTSTSLIIINLYQMALLLRFKIIISIFCHDSRLKAGLYIWLYITCVST